MAYVHTGPPRSEPALSTQLLTARLGAARTGGGITTPSLVQVVAPIEPGSPLVGSINGVDADVFPVTRDYVTGEPDVVRFVAPAANPAGGWSIPSRGTSSSALRLEQAPGTFHGDTLKECDLSDLQLSMEVRGFSGVRFVARPFQAGHPTVLRTKVRRDGRYIRQTATLCRFIKQGVQGEPTEREDECLLVEVFRTTRSDYRAETLDFVVMNGRWRASDDPYSVSPTGDGGFRFRLLQLVGIDGQDQVELFLPRPGHHTISSSGVWMVTAPSGGAGRFHYMAPGSYFARRLVIYRGNEVPVQVARDIVQRKDFSWAEGEIGYANHSVWAGYARAPRFLDLPPARGGASPFDDLINYGEEYEADWASRVTGTLIQDVGLIYAGWSKPLGPKQGREPGEGQLDLIGMEAPSPGMFRGKLIECDGTVERHHLAVYNLDTLEPARIQDYAATDPQGRLPYSFAGVNLPIHYVPLHMVTRSGASFPGTGDPPANPLAPDDLTWNQDGAGEETPFRFVTDWQNLPAGNWGPHWFTHSGRTLNSTKACLYALDDPVAELALRFQGLAAVAGRCHRDARSDGAVTRFNDGRVQSNLRHIVDVVIPVNDAHRGSWGLPPENPTQGYGQNTARDFFHSMAAVMGLYHLGEDEVRAELDGSGTVEDSWWYLACQVIDFATTGNGMFTVTGKLDADSRGGPEPDFATRTGALPSGPTVHSTDQAWPVAHVFHQSYAAQSTAPLVRMLAATPGAEALLDRLIKQPDIMESACEVHRPDGTMRWPANMHGSVGTQNADNPELTEAQARAGDGIWFGTADIAGNNGFVDRKPWSLFAQLPAYFERFGDWGGCLRLAKRQFAAPSTMSDEELLARLWRDLVDGGDGAGGNAGPYQDPSGGFQFMRLNFIAWLQHSGVRHPDVPTI